MLTGNCIKPGVTHINDTPIGTGMRGLQLVGPRGLTEAARRWLRECSLAYPRSVPSRNCSGAQYCELTVSAIPSTTTG
jgi:hypothetical protein